MWTSKAVLLDSNPFNIQSVWTLANEAIIQLGLHGVELRLYVTSFLIVCAKFQRLHYPTETTTVWIEREPAANRGWRAPKNPGFAKTVWWSFLFASQCFPQYFGGHFFFFFFFFLRKKVVFYRISSYEFVPREAEWNTKISRPLNGTSWDRTCVV